MANFCLIPSIAMAELQNNNRQAESFEIQFSMSSVQTHAVIRKTEPDKYGVFLRLTEFFENEEIPAAGNEIDAVITPIQNGNWKVIGQPKIHFNDQDINNLGSAIEAYENKQSER